MYPLLIREVFLFLFFFGKCGTEEIYKMVIRNARLIPTTEKSGLATPLWSDSEFKTLLGEQMDLIVTEKVRQELTQKYEIHPDKTWSVDECKKVLGASIRKNNVKGIICCHREFILTLATQQSQRNSELEKQNNELLTKKLNLKKAAAKTDVNNSSVVQIQTVAKALCPKDIERLSQSLPSARTHFSEFRRTLISKMRLYDMSLAEVTQLMSQILTESEFNSFESAVTSELRNASKGDLKEGILKMLKNILGPKIDWSRITTCVQRKKASSGSSKSTTRPGKKLIVGAVSSYLSPVIQHNDQRIFVKGSVKEKEIDFLLDTGAEITVIPTKLAQGLNIPYKKTKLCLTGVIGEDSVLYETPPIEVQFGPKTLTTKLLCAPLNTGAILGMDLLRQINLTLDMSSESTSIKISSAQISTNNATPPEYAFLQNHPNWAKDKDDCGLLTGVEPVKLTGTPPPVTKQYPINKEAIQGIKLIVENLLTQRVLVKTNSPCNSPIWPIKKSNGTWRLTIDYRVANKHIDKITPLVADPSTICNGLPLDCKIFSVIDMSNGFFSVPLHSDSQPWLAFTVDYEQYQWTRLPQGFQNSPTIYHQAVRRDLCDPECPVKQSTMIQYVDDILIASTDHEVHQTELASLLDYLHKKGHKCSFHKAQIAKKQVTFLGQIIGAGNRSITQDRAASVKAIPPPTTIKTLRSFLEQQVIVDLGLKTMPRLLSLSMIC